MSTRISRPRASDGLQSPVAQPVDGALISIRSLTYSYPRAEVASLIEVNLQIETGEFVLVAGPSGSGKSTLLRCLNGLVPHFSGGEIAGRVVVAGHDVLQVGPRPLSREVGFVFQDADSQYVLDNVESEVAFALENAAIEEREMILRVEEVLALLELGALRSRSIHSLSGGERQRVSIAAALALRPKILALDEPTSQLDPQSAEEVLQALVRLNVSLGLTIVLVEHRLERIAQYADRLVYLEDGRISTDANVREAMACIPRMQAPPLARLGRVLGWHPLPLSVKEALSYRRQLHAPTVKRTEANRRQPVQSREPVLRIKDLSYAYDGRPALCELDLQVRPGEVAALMGRNGSGKTTLLRCVAGLLRPASGDIEVNGRATRGLEVAEICRNVGYLPQQPDDLLFSDTVLDELYATLTFHNLAPNELGQSPEGLLVELGLDKLANRYPRDISVGERQRVALGAVTVTRPELVLLDEPTQGLDFAGKRALMELLAGWRAEGTAMLLVTHDVEMAARMADHVFVMSNGRIIAQGPKEAVLPTSSLLAPQIARLFPEQGWLTVEDALEGLAPYHESHT